jgi:FkbM family methyltransferase
VSEGLGVPHVVGSLYTQRIGSVEVLLNAVYAELAELHDPGGDVLQLIGVQTLSHVNAGAGGLLLNHAFEAAAKHSLASVAAVTRCRTFSHDSRDLLGSMRSHSAGDPGVLFHTSRGALLVDLVRSYRPEDSANGGVGVLVRYNLAPSVVENLVSQMQGRPLCTENLHSVEQSGLSFYYLNHHGEVDYTYEEVFRRSCYLQHGAKIGAGGIVFDVGANQGLFSVFCSGLAANVQVHSFEPIPAIYDVAAKNRELYQVQGHHHNLGLAEQIESVDFTFYPGLSVLSGRYANSDDDTRTFMQYDSFAHKNRSKDRQEVMQAIDCSQVLTLCGLLQKLASRVLKPVTVRCELKTASSVIDEYQIDRIDLLKV